MYQKSILTAVFRIITLFYGIGAGMALIACWNCFFSYFSCSNSLLSSMSFYSVIGGLYLPFVTDAVIKLLGSQHRAFGSATIDFGDTVASFISPILAMSMHHAPLFILINTVFLCLLATFFQWRAEKEVKAWTVTEVAWNVWINQDKKNK